MPSPLGIWEDMKSYKHRESRGLLFIAPAALTYLVMMIVPLVGTLLLGFSDWNGLSLAHLKWIGLANYSSMLQDKVLGIALRNNLLLIAIAVPIQTFVGLAFALILEKGLPLSKLFRGFFFLPSVIPFVVSGLVFTILMTPGIGLATIAGSAHLPIFLRRILATDWLGSSRTAFPTIIAAEVWLLFGYNMFLFVAKLKSLPSDLNEAAVVDGARPTTVLFRIVLPQLRSTILLVLMISIISEMKVFNSVYVMTWGGPGYSTQVLAVWSYFNAFTAYNYSYGAAISTILLIITLVLTVIVLRFMNDLREE